ncbi:N-acetylneuraminate lyase [Streptococcus pneumoniae]|nr:N-acetylneuraminate lyase [Streptococcus pneumoniae]
MKDLTKYKGVIPAFYACYDENESSIMKLATLP